MASLPAASWYFNPSGAIRRRYFDGVDQSKHPVIDVDPLAPVFTGGLNRATISC